MSLVTGFLAPAAIALGLVWLLRRWSPANSDDRSLLSAAVAAAYFAGYVLLPDWAELRPSRHWQWLPYVGVAAAAVTAPSARTRTLAAIRWALLAIAAAIAAWKVVPTWDDLWPPRYWSLAMLAGYFLVLSALLEALPDRLCGSALPGLLLLAALGVMIVLVAAAVSVKFAQLAGLLAAALAGCWIASWWSSGPFMAASARGLFPVYAMLLGGAAYVGCIDKQPPLFILLAMPAAPLALWLFVAGPLSRLQGRAATAAQAIAVLIPLLAAGVVACVAGSPAPPPW